MNAILTFFGDDRSEHDHFKIMNLTPPISSPVSTLQHQVIKYEIHRDLRRGKMGNVILHSFPDAHISIDRCQRIGAYELQAAATCILPAILPPGYPPKSLHPQWSRPSTDMQAAAPVDRSAGEQALRYRAGDVVIAADPLVHILSPDHRGKRCDGCTKKW